MGEPSKRYGKLARALLDSPDPVHAIASLVGDHEARIDILIDRVRALEFAKEAAS